MKRFFDPYLKQIGIMTILLLIAGATWNYFFPQWKAADWWPLYLAFFFLINVFSHFLLIQSLKGKPAKFIGLFMGVTLGKLVLYLTALVLNVLYAPFLKASIIVPFLIFYIAFTFFEVKTLSAQVKKKNQ
jgi:hypothetical protein